jgi:ATP-dependent phosphofructokinase / diphosphate-dependent phosphofructokinase
VILIPEIPYDIEKIVEKIEQRYSSGREFAIVVIAEGAKPAGGSAVYQAEGRYGGVAERLSADIARVTGHESRSLVLGHLQRGGPPNAYDRLLALRFGAAAVRLANEGKFGTMVAIDPPNVRAVPLEEAVRELKRVPVDGDVVQTARSLGVCFGD